jgi:transcriptional regulator with XRE-family HTH domain
MAKFSMPVTLKVGTGLPYWRQRHDPPLSAVEVATMLNVSKSTFCLIEQGRLLPSPRMLEELVRVLGVPPGALFVPEVIELVLTYGETGDPLRHLD